MPFSWENGIKTGCSLENNEVNYDDFHKDHSRYK